MKIDKITAIIFSPAGSTSRVVQSMEHWLGLPVHYVDVTSYEKRQRAMEFGVGDLVIFAVPVYGGRVPAPAMETIGQMKGNKTPAIYIATYGNREFEDALLELKNATVATGFVPLSAAAIVAEHSIMHSVATGRPDGKDLEFLQDFTTKTMDKIAMAQDANALNEVAVKGSEPYRDFGGLPLKPTASKQCDGCGICAKHCPVNAIPSETPRETDQSRCMSCMGCIAVCPQKARRINPVMLTVVETAFAAKNKARKEPEMFL